MLNMNKLLNELIKDENVRDIPVTYVFAIVTAIFELINSGKFYIENE